VPYSISNFKKDNELVQNLDTNNFELHSRTLIRSNPPMMLAYSLTLSLDNSFL